VTGIDFVGQSFVNFRHHAFSDAGAHGFRWVDLKTFRIRAAGRSADLLAAVVAHEQFRDDYAGGGVDPDGSRHGPYWISEMSPGAYGQVGNAEAARVLRDWAVQHGALPRSLEALLDGGLFAVLASASRLYRLRDLGSSAFHDWGGVHGEFHEFIAIDDGQCLLTLLVAADD
jgi:hypothetical protein